ncbi:hypothetical protein D0Z00_001066 [Geotrichum galactomycetum]|uniref:Uncharacterized protein n=1 Tax=Geotrichum galactomycetum TaxID=27317 RepID=A0ACB6V832_9ASCO|nr:hypothetical protein D0Z00_001066 [Geotrichum candidum]
MLFGIRLANQIHPPWKEEYIAYDKLKKLLKESVVPHGTRQDDWSETDETNFVSVLDSELEKVYSFQSRTYSSLSDKISEIEKSINQAESFKIEDAKSFEAQLEEILEAARELDTFSRLNFTGFTKIVKKHDRLHPKYQVKPLLQVRLAALPFHSEDYSPLLYRLSVLYAFLGENFGANSTPAGLSSVVAGDNTDYTTYKFWVHPENVMEVKTRILRHLPLLIYGSNNKSGTGEDNEEAGEPTISSLYFDNPNLELYESKLQKSEVSPSLRLRWVGKLSDKPEITLEKKVVDHTVTGEYIPDEKLLIKEKYIQPFIEGKYSMEKTIKKMKERGSTDTDIETYKKTVDNIQTFIQEHDISPVMRTMYTRTAFQIPGDNRVRAILDSNIVFIREDAFDESRPVRDPESWHRSDIDAPGIKEPLSLLRKGEFSKFPFAVLEFRVLTRTSSDNKGKTPGSVDPNATVPAIKRHGKWIQELTNSHLVKEVPKFSKFIQGIASLFAEDDRLDALPFWVNDLEHDIRQDPKQAWEEQKRRLKEAASVAQESNKIRLRTTSGTRLPQSPLFSGLEDNSIRSQISLSAGGSSSALVEEIIEEEPNDDADIDDDDSTDDGETDISSEALRKQKSKSLKSRIRNLSFLPNQGPRLNMDSEDEEIVLPPGVVKPSLLIRNSGPVKVETKVWLANERTFNKWLHITTLLSALTFTLYSSVGRTSSQQTAEYVAYILFALTIFSGLWGYGTYLQRLKYIKARSERHLDNPIGPIIIALGLLAALIVNFISNYKIHHGDSHPGVQPNVTVTF